MLNEKRGVACYGQFYKEYNQRKLSAHNLK